MPRIIPTRARFIPDGATRISHKPSATDVYLYTAGNRPCAKAYVGKADKYVFNMSFANETTRERHVRSFIGAQIARLAAKAETAARRTAPNLLCKGDILSASYGWEQTNIDFFEVLDVSGQYATICKIAAVSEETSSMIGKCRPLPGQPTGEPMRKLVQWGDSVRIASYATARKWNTHEVAGVKMGPTMNWTAYA